MNKFYELRRITQEKILPIICKNEDNEVVIIEYGISNGERFFKVTTAQHNDWCRINTYWESGIMEETYRK